MLHPQSVLASDANLYDALDDADNDNACSQPDICQQLLAVAALVDGAPQPGAHDIGRPIMFFHFLGTLYSWCHSLQLRLSTRSC